MNGKEDLRLDELQNLLQYFLKNAYRAKEGDTQGESILNTCLRLFKKDYKFSLIDNANGELCSHYPTKIPILEYSATDNDKSNDCVESMYDLEKLKELFSKARYARCRTRFAVPVMLFEGKHICRGATLAGGAEIYGRSSFDFFMTGGESIPIPDSERHPQASDTSSSTNSEGSGNSSDSWQLFNRIRGRDIRLLKTFSVSYICDLMVEKKKVKFGMNVTSSEKVDKEKRYSDFHILSAPYPGCEFFREWRENGYRAEGMVFDWTQGYVDAMLRLPERLTPPYYIDWSRYRTWDLVQLTQNYLRLLLHYIREGDSGILVHCISGWDRTPLFISLLRLSLWADGAVHASLTAREILYHTIAYDWFLFGHNLPDRMEKGEEIFFFCFNFLKHIISDDFSVYQRKQARTVSQTDSESLMDGVLLDHEFQRCTYRGSNTSLSSGSSSVEGAPIIFNTGATDEDASVSNGTPVGMGANAPRMCPAPRPAPARLPSDSSQGSGGTLRAASYRSFSTSPVAVPTKITEMKNSPNFGSWQMISGTGSYRGSASSSHESPRSSGSDQSNAVCQSCCDNRSEEQGEETVRKQKLDVVRRTFLSIYTSTMTKAGSPYDSGGGGGGASLTGFLENFAEKVGFKSSKNSAV